MPQHEDILKAAAVVKRGGVIAYPTEAVFGLGCDPHNEAAVRRILTLKQRSADLGLIIVASEFAQIERLLAVLGDATRQQMFASWPGPMTWVAPAAPDTPQWLTGAHATLAVRVTAHPLTAALCTLAGPLVSTSANPHAQPPARTVAEVQRYFGTELDFIVSGVTGGAAHPTEIRDAMTGAILRPPR